MPPLRSRTVTHGRNMAGARALLRATGVAREDIGKPIIAVANSFTEFVPGHVHLREVGQVVADAVRAAGAIPREFNTIAVDDGIAMGHGGMLYSLPSRELIADSVEYMVNAHCADAMICISNCDKITPGMLIATMRLNIPTVFVSGGPMEAGRARPGCCRLGRRPQAGPDRLDGRLGGSVGVRRAAAGHGGVRLPDLRLVLGHVHRQLDELPDRGDRPGPAGQREHAGHAHGAARAVRAGGRADRGDHPAVLRRRRRVGAAAVDRQPGRVRERDGAGRGHGRVDEHDPAPARRRARGGGRTSGSRRSTSCPAGCRACARSRRAAPTTSRTCTGRAASRRSWASWTGPGCSTAGCARCTARRCGSSSTRGTCGRRRLPHEAVELYHARAGRGADDQAVLAVVSLGDAGCRPGWPGASGTRRTPTPPTAGWPCSTATWPRTARSSRPPGVPEELWTFSGPAVVFESQEDAVAGILGGAVRAGRRGGHPVRGAARRAWHAGDAVPDQLPQGQGARPGLRADHRRAVLRRDLGPVDLPRRAGGGGGRADRAGRGRRHGGDRHPAPGAAAGRARCRAGRAAGPGAGLARVATGPPTGSGRSARRCRSTRRWPRRPRPARPATSR